VNTLSRWRWLPNAVSVLRALLVVPLFLCIVDGRLRLALALMLVAALSDALDGFLAKRCGWKTALGTVLDPAADKLLLVGTFFALTWIGYVPVWLFALVLLRDLVISIGAYAYRRIMGRLSVKPSRISKLNTIVQFLFVVLLLAETPYLHLAVWWLAFATGAATLSTVLSGVDYVWAYGWPALGVLRDRTEPS
jgi:cardiolipin synthase